MTRNAMRLATPPLDARAVRAVAAIGPDASIPLHPDHRFGLRPGRVHFSAAGKRIWISQASRVEPLSPRERGWGEGCHRTQEPRP